MKKPSLILKELEQSVALHQGQSRSFSSSETNLYQLEKAITKAVRDAIECLFAVFHRHWFNEEYCPCINSTEKVFEQYINALKRAVEVARCHTILHIHSGLRSYHDQVAQGVQKHWRTDHWDGDPDVCEDDACSIDEILSPTQQRRLELLWSDTASRRQYEKWRKREAQSPPSCVADKKCSRCKNCYCNCVVRAKLGYWICIWCDVKHDSDKIRMSV